MFARLRWTMLQRPGRQARQANSSINTDGPICLPQAGTTQVGISWGTAVNGAGLPKITLSDNRGRLKPEEQSCNADLSSTDCALAGDNNGVRDGDTEEDSRSAGCCPCSFRPGRCGDGRSA